MRYENEYWHSRIKVEPSDNVVKKHVLLLLLFYRIKNYSINPWQFSINTSFVLEKVIIRIFFDEKIFYYILKDIPRLKNKALNTNINLNGTKKY